MALDANDYIHRIGRTGRKDATGLATTFATPDDEEQISQVLRRLSVKVYEHSVPDDDPDEFSRRPVRHGRSSSRQKRRSNLILANNAGKERGDEQNQTRHQPMK